MAKIRRNRRRIYKKTKWSANIQEFSSNEQVNVGVFFLESTLATNPSQNILGVSQIFTVKNPEISFIFKSDSVANTANIDDLSVYIMFVPQGMTVTEDYNTQHPEYMLAYKFYGSPFADTGSQNYQPFKIKSRLSRKLNTGDKIILLIKGFNNSNTNNNLIISGLTRWWTKAN